MFLYVLYILVVAGMSLAVLVKTGNALALLGLLLLMFMGNVVPMIPRSRPEPDREPAIGFTAEVD
jgi:hypothetical protein